MEVSGLTVTFSWPTTSQWKALVSGFLGFIPKLKGKGGGAGILGREGSLTTEAPEWWLRGSTFVDKGVRGCGKVVLDKAETCGGVGDGTGGETSGRMTLYFFELRGFGVGCAWPTGEGPRLSSDGGSLPPEGGSTFSTALWVVFLSSNLPLDSGSESVSSGMLRCRGLFFFIKLLPSIDFLFQPEHSASIAWTQASRSFWTDPGAAASSGRGTRNL